MKELTNGKCKDTRNRAAEFLKHTGEKTRRIFAKTCTDIMRDSQIPTSWTKNTITVLRKAG